MREMPFCAPSCAQAAASTAPLFPTLPLGAFRAHAQRARLTTLHIDGAPRPVLETASGERWVLVRTLSSSLLGSVKLAALLVDTAGGHNEAAATIATPPVLRAVKQYDTALLEELTHTGCLRGQRCSEDVLFELEAMRRFGCGGGGGTGGDGGALAHPGLLVPLLGRWRMPS